MNDQRLIERRHVIAVVGTFVLAHVLIGVSMAFTLGVLSEHRLDAVVEYLLAPLTGPWLDGWRVPSTLLLLTAIVSSALAIIRPAPQRFLVAALSLGGNTFTSLCILGAGI